MKPFVQKLLSAVVLVAVSLTSLSVVNQVPEAQAVSWDRASAEHLARRVLFAPTEQMITDLTLAWSPQAAVQILFPSAQGPSRLMYDAKMADFLQGSLYSETGTTQNRRLYQFRLLSDPYEAKAKLWLLLEDIFSVNQDSGHDISFTDVNNLHSLIYSHALGSYKDLIRDIVYNPAGNRGDYAASQFLDLLNQTDKRYPNENYARELLQLFLMFEYYPLASRTDERHYTEADVASFAKILTGFRTQSGTHIVTFDPQYHLTGSKVEFLTGSLPDGVSYPFVSSGNLIDLESIVTPLNGNRGLSDNILDYIFAKRGHAISMFLANKLYRYYVSEDPTLPELEQIANKLETTQFDMYQTVTFLLASDMMYSDKAKQEFRWKSPTDLVIGSLKYLHQNDTGSLLWDEVFVKDADMLTRLGYTPYIPGSIFGRDGYDENNKWITSYTINQFVSSTTQMVAFAGTGSYNLLSLAGVSSSGSLTLSGVTASGALASLEQKLLIGRHIPEQQKTDLIQYITSGGVLLDSTTGKERLKNTIAIILSSPEFLIQSGYTNPAQNSVGNGSVFGNNNGKLVIVRLGGGLDWLSVMVPKDEYSFLSSKRAAGMLPTTELIDLGDYYLNKSMSGLAALYDSNNVRFVNRIGVERHSRDHDAATNMTSTKDNQAGIDAQGFFGKMIENEFDASNTIVLSTEKPSIFQGGKYLNIGASAANMQRYSGISAAENNLFLSLVRSGYATRTDFPDKTQRTFQDVVKIDDIARASAAQWGLTGAGYNNSQNLDFVKVLLSNNFGKAFYMRGDSGFDTHSDQYAYLNQKLGALSNNLSSFFNAVKGTENITIIVYSEFGRTIALNGDAGTDHGNGGGMIMLSNNQELLNSLPQKIMGKMKPSLEVQNWLSDGVDYGALWDKLVRALYPTLDPNNYLPKPFSLENELASVPPKPLFEHMEYNNLNNQAQMRWVIPEVQDTNFNAWMGSNTTFAHGSTTGYTSVLNQWILNNYVPQADKSLVFTASVPYASIGKQYFYKYSLRDNQYDSFADTGAVMYPKSCTTGIADIAFPCVVSVGATKFHNTYVLGDTLLVNDGFALSTGTILYQTNAFGNITVPADTRITTVSSGTGRVWNGAFLPLQTVQTHFPDVLSLDGQTFSSALLTNLIKVGADSFVTLKANKPVTLQIARTNTSTIVVTSENLKEWSTVPNVTSGASAVSFATDALRYFALLQTGSVVTGSNSGSTTTSGSTASGSTGGGTTETQTGSTASGSTTSGSTVGGGSTTTSGSTASGSTGGGTTETQTGSTASGSTTSGSTVGSGSTSTGSSMTGSTASGTTQTGSLIVWTGGVFVNTGVTLPALYSGSAFVTQLSGSLILKDTGTYIWETTSGLLKTSTQSIPPLVRGTGSLSLPQTALPARVTLLTLADKPQTISFVSQTGSIVPIRECQDEIFGCYKYSLGRLQTLVPAGAVTLVWAFPAPKPVVAQTPVIQWLDVQKMKRNQYAVRVRATDPDGQKLQYTFAANGIVIKQQNDPIYLYNITAATTATVTVTDTDGNKTSQSVALQYELPQAPSVSPMAYSLGKGKMMVISNAFDTDGKIARVTFAFNGRVLKDSPAISTTLSAQGSGVLTVTAVDNE